MSLNYDLIYFPAAKKDFLEAKNWYPKISLRLGMQFSAAVAEAFAVIKNNPLAFGVRYENIRIAHPESFPYNIHFYIQDKMIIIVAILHSKRNPAIGTSRTK